MAQQDKIELEGRIVDKHPGGTFTVEIEQENGEKHRLLCSVSGKLRMNFIRILIGDIVTVEMSPYDLTRGRITWRGKKTTN